MNFTNTRGLALTCDLQGQIMEVLRNDLGIYNAETGHLFFRMVDSSSRQKAMRFMAELKEHSSVVDWELGVSCDDGILTMHFTGNRLGDNLLISASTSDVFAREIYEEMLRINNEQTNRLRSTLKDIETMRPVMGDQRSFDEITRLNNELVSIQRDLAKKNAELARLNTLKNDFLGLVAHDLLQPLRDVLQNSAALLDKPDRLDADQTRQITAIHSQSQFMTQLVNDLLEVAANETDNLILDPQPVDFAELLKAALDRSRHAAAGKQIRFELETQPLPMIMADPLKLGPVLDNLLATAIGYSPAGGKVFVSLGAAENEMRFAVRDEGPGLSSAEVDTLFIPFTRANFRSISGPAGQRRPGPGLLSARRVVGGHGGSIWAESRPGFGTTFHIALPITSRSSQEEPIH